MLMLVISLHASYVANCINIMCMLDVYSFRHRGGGCREEKVLLWRTMFPVRWETFPFLSFRMNRNEIWMGSNGSKRQRKFFSGAWAFRNVWANKKEYIVDGRVAIRQLIRVLLHIEWRRWWQRYTKIIINNNKKTKIFREKNIFMSSKTKLMNFPVPIPFFACRHRKLAHIVLHFPCVHALIWNSFDSWLHNATSLSCVFIEMLNNRIRNQCFDIMWLL